MDRNLFLSGRIVFALFNFSLIALAPLSSALWIGPSVARAMPQANDPFGEETVRAKRFELKAPGLEQPSIATITAEELSIRSPDGALSVYKRLARYDTNDGAYVSYSSRELQQIIRWPTSDRGGMQIGTLQQGKIQFSPSRMTVHPVVGRETGSGATRSIPGSTVLPSLQEQPPSVPRQLPTPSQIPGETRRTESGVAGGVFPTMSPMHFAVGSGTKRYLSLEGSDRFQLLNGPDDPRAAWFIQPVRDDLVRVQQRVDSRWMAIGVGGPQPRDAGRSRRGTRGFPSGPSFGGGVFPPGVSFGGGGSFGAGGFPALISPIHGGIDQLWRVQSYSGGGYYFESVMYPGMCLTFPVSGGLWVRPWTYDPWQIWYPMPPVVSLPVPQFKTTQQQFVPNPTLPPIDIRLTNRHSDELLVLFADRRIPDNPVKIRIPAGGSKPVRIERDAGGTIVENISIVDAFGNWVDEQYTTPVPPAVLYDLSVYEIFLQSIAIDRTGTSPNVVEDVNFQPRSIGFFLLPPGDELVEGSELDTYRAAQEQENPGAVRRLSERDLKEGSNSNTKDPLKEILNQVQKQRAAF